MPVDLSNEAYKFGVNYFIYAIDALISWQLSRLESSRAEPAES